MKIKAVIVDDFIRETVYEPIRDTSEAYAVINGIKIRVPNESKCVVMDTDEVKRNGIEEADKLYRRIMNMRTTEREKAFGHATFGPLLESNTYDELSEKLAAYDRDRDFEAKELIHRLKDLGYKVIEYKNTVTLGERGILFS